MLVSAGMSTRKIATSTLWQLGSQITMAALSIITVKFVAIGLSKELAGHYNSAYGFLQVFGVLADFGLYAVAIREISKAKEKESILGALLFLRGMILCLSLGTALLFVWIVPQWQGTPLPLSVSIAAFVPFFTLLAGMIRAVFQVEYKMQYVFVAEVLQRIITVALIAGFIATGIRLSNDPRYCYIFLAAGGVGSLVLFLLSAFLGNRLIPLRPKIEKKLLIELLKKAAPYGLAFFCMALYRQFDVTLIALLRPAFELHNAYYGFVLRMTDVGFILPTFLLNSTLPMLTERDAKGEDTRLLLGKTLLIILTMGSISLLFSVLWSRPLIQLLTTDAYLSIPGRAGSDTALRLMSIPMLLNGLVAFSFYTLLTKHAWKKLVLYLGIGALFSLALNIFLIPSLGFVGANISSIATHILLVSVLLPTSLLLLPAKFPASYTFSWISFSVLLGIGLVGIRPLLTSNLMTIAGLLAGFVLIGILAYMTKLMRNLKGS